MERTGLRRQSVERLIWYDQDIATTKTPSLTKARILGVFDVNTRRASIHIIVDHKGTEYRVTRWDKEVLAITKADPDDLKYAHRNMISHFLDNHMNKDFKLFLKQWLTWNQNPTYHHILVELLK